MREKNSGYTGGDEWVSVGAWFSGNWYDGEINTPYSDANWYISQVRNYLSQKTWLKPDFLY